MLDQATIREAVTEVARKHGAHKVILFGSYARGTATPDSDVDLLVVESTRLPFLSRLDRYFDPLVDRLQIGIEVFVYTPEELERMMESGFVAQAVREGVLLYESGEISSDLIPADVFTADEAEDAIRVAAEIIREVRELMGPPT